MLFVGVDAHKVMSQVTVMDDAGKVLRRKRVASSLPGIRGALEGYPQPMKAVLEASYSWGPLYDWLTEVAGDVVLAHPMKVRAIAEARIKTDTIDSETLAHLLRADLIPAAYAPSKQVRAVKRVLRQRMFFVRIRTMVKNRIQALLHQHAVELPEVRDLFGKVGLRALQRLELPEPDGGLLQEDLAVLEELGKRIARTEEVIKTLATGDHAVGWLSSLPGIGTFFSVLIRYEVDDISRFRAAKKFTSYTGLVPSTYASGTRILHGRLTKQGNKWLRWAFIEAVTPAVRSSPYLRRYYAQMKARRGTKDARTATARKLAELAWTVWTEQRRYEECRPTCTNQVRTPAALSTSWA
jgi:transposase